MVIFDEQNKQQIVTYVQMYFKQRTNTITTAKNKNDYELYIDYVKQQPWYKEGS